MLSFTSFFRVLFVLITSICSLMTSMLPAAGMKITTTPAVFDCGNDYYNVVWVTSKKGSGYVKYTYDGEEKIIWDADNGIIRTDDTIHTVLVPKNELQDNTYVVGSQYVGFKYAYSATKGNTVECDPINFRGTPKEDDIKILCLTDIHELTEEPRQAVANINETPDMLVLLGDMTSSLEYKSQLTDHILTDAGDFSRGEIPVIYTRGNHETRGEYAAQMSKYLPTETGTYYYTTEFGALSAVVLDSGEDKDDSHEDYGGLIDFENYRRNEFNWINSLQKEEFDGTYKIVFCHNPSVSNHFGQNWISPFNELDFDLLVGGHLHIASYYEQELPTFVAGGKVESGWASSMVTLRDGNIRMYTIDLNGNVLVDKTIKA